MKAKHFFPILVLLTILTLPVLAGATVVHAQTVPLEYYYSGSIKPGYIVTIQLHSVGMTAVPIPISHAFADSGIEFQGHRYGIVGTDGGGPTVEVFYLVDGQRIKIDEFHYGKKEYDAWVKITAYCPGEQPQGAPTKPDSQHFWVKVDFNGQYTRWNLLQLGGDANAGVPLQLFYEHTPGMESWARVVESTQFNDCGNNVIGTPPGSGDDTRQDNSGDNEPVWKSLVTNKWLLGLGAVIIILLLIRGLLPW